MIRRMASRVEIGRWGWKSGDEGDGRGSWLCGWGKL